MCICSGTECSQGVSDADIFPGSQVGYILTLQDDMAFLGTIRGIIKYIHPKAEIDHLLYSFEQIFFWMVEDQPNGIGGTNGQK